MKLRSMMAAAVLTASCCLPAIANAQAVTLAQAETPVDPERLALAHQLLDEMDLPKLLHGTFEKAFSGFSGNVGGLDMGQYGRSMTAGLEAILPGMLDEEAKAYARVLSADDLRQAVAFYHSQAGKDMLAAAPAVTAQMTPTIYASMPKMFHVLSDDYCAHVQCTPEIRKAFKLGEEMMGRMGSGAAH